MSEDRNTSEAGSFLESLRENVGAFGKTHPTRDDVNQAMIRHWCDAMDDHNPLYTEPEAGQKSIHGGIVAPPSMLDSWSMVGLSTFADDDDEPSGMLKVLDQLEAAGFTSIVATNTSHEYDRYLKPGDRLSLRSRVSDVTPEKKTALGIGHFVTTETEFLDARNDRVGRMEFRVFKYKPDATLLEGGGDPTGAPMAGRPRPAISRDTKFFWDGVEEGELRIQKCEGCGTLHHPPMVRCPECGSYDLGYTVSSGRGTVYSFAEVHYPQYPIFLYPLVGVLVELEEGTRLMSNLAGLGSEQIYIGMPVELSIEEVEPGLKLPLFRPAREPRNETTRCFEEVAVDEALAPCPVPITTTQIVAGAMASRDFQDVHHDPELAKQRGSPNIFMNIMTSLGLATRYVTDWAGPEALLRNVKIRLGVPNYPGDTMTLFARVTKTRETPDGGLLELEVRGANRMGDHLSGTMELELPRRDHGAKRGES